MFTASQMLSYLDEVGSHFAELYVLRIWLCRLPIRSSNHCYKAPRPVSIGLERRPTLRSTPYGMTDISCALEKLGRSWTHRPHIFTHVTLLQFIVLGYTSSTFRLDPSQHLSLSVSVKGRNKSSHGQSHSHLKPLVLYMAKYPYSPLCNSTASHTWAARQATRRRQTYQSTWYTTSDRLATHTHIHPAARVAKERLNWYRYIACGWTTLLCT